MILAVSTVNHIQEYTLPLDFDEYLHYSRIVVCTEKKEIREGPDNVNLFNSSSAENGQAGGVSKLPFGMLHGP